MQYANTMTTYGSVSKFFHWLIFILLFCMIIFGYFLEDIPKDYQPIAYNIHKLTGLTILMLMVLRLIWKLSNPRPLLPADLPSWQRTADRVVQFLLYAIVIAMPLAGWIGSVAAGRAPHIGNFNFGLPIEKSKVLAEAAFDMHGMFAIILIVLFSIHLSAALYHYFILHDNVLQRMLPRHGIK